MPSPEDDSRDMEKTEGSRCEFQGFRGRKSLESRQQWLFKPWGVASEARLGGEMGAEKAAGACGEQLTSVLGSILGGCCPGQRPVPEAAVLDLHLLVQPHPGVTLDPWLRTASTWRPAEGLVLGV